MIQVTIFEPPEHNHTYIVQQGMGALAYCRYISHRHHSSRSNLSFRSHQRMCATYLQHILKVSTLQLDPCLFLSTSSNQTIIPDA